MRMTITIDDDVLERAREIAARLRKPFKAIVNEALRVGLERMEGPLRQRPYKTKPHRMGLREGCNLDDIQELLSRADEDSR